MSDDFYADMRELNTLALDLATAGARVGLRGAVAVRKTAHDIEATSKQFAPVDTGNLRNSIGIDINGDGRSGAIEAVIGPTADYGEYVEFGTTTQPPQAFMGPALDRHGYELVEVLGMIGATAL